MSAEVGISTGSVYSILHKDMTNLCQHLVPKMLTPEHKETRMILAEDDDQDDVAFWNHIITQDET
jgi:hypothetical protein